jgi:hypothetical protein
MRASLRRVIAAHVLLWLCVMLAGAQYGFCAEGTFQGRIVDAPPDDPLPKGWIFVQGRNRLLRRVEVAHATIVFSGQVPASQRRKCGPECLEQGQEIKVTAEQDASGEWRATRVEILQLATGRA